MGIVATSQLGARLLYTVSYLCSFQGLLRRRLVLARQVPDTYLNGVTRFIGLTSAVILWPCAALLCFTLRDGAYRFYPD